MIRPRRQRGFTLFELAVVLVIGIALIAAALVMGKQANTQSNFNAALSGLGQTVGEIHRLYTDTSTGYGGITATDVMTRGASLQGVWVPAVARWNAGGLDWWVAPSNILPGGATGTANDGFVLFISPMHTDQCRALIAGLSKQATSLVVVLADGSAPVAVTISPGVAAPATVETACNRSTPNKVLRAYFN